MPTTDLLQAFCHSRKLWETIFSCIQHVVIVTDVEGYVLLGNPMVETMFGFTPDEFNGKNLSIIFTPDDLTHLYPNLLHMARKNEPFKGEITLIRKDETCFLSYMAFRPYFNPRQDTPLIVISIQDIDKHRHIHGGLARPARACA